MKQPSKSLEEEERELFARFNPLRNGRKRDYFYKKWKIVYDKLTLKATA